MTQITLRDYQDDAVDLVDKSFVSSDRSVLVLPTGAGKTVVFCYYADRENNQGKAVGIVAHRAELLTQASLSFARMGVYHQMIGPPALTKKCKALHIRDLGRVFIDPFSSVYIGSAQTMVRRLDKLPKLDLLVIDEAAHATAGQWLKIIEHYNVRTLGVTATPCRSDGAGLGRVFDDMVVGIDQKTLIANGSLSDYVVYSPPNTFDASEVRKVGSGERKGEYNQNDVAEQLDKPQIVGEAVEHYKKYADGKRCLVFAVSVAGAEHVAQKFREAGYNFVAVSGATDDMERYQAVEDLKTHKIDGIVNCSIFTEGTSIDSVECLIMMSPISDAAFGLFSQEVGRVLRTFEGKDKGIIIDMVGNFHRHGFPEDKTDWTLDDRKKGKKSKEEDEDTEKVRTCPEPLCLQTHRNEKICGSCRTNHQNDNGCKSQEQKVVMCPSCGYVYPVAAGREYEHVDGELVELERQQLVIQNKADQNEGIRNAKTKQDLLAVDKKLGHKAGAAEHKKRAIEEKRQAMATLNKAIKYYKESICWGNITMFESVMQTAFKVTEADAKKYGATRANRLTDEMRDLAKLIQSEVKQPHSAYNYELYLRSHGFAM